MTSQYTNFNIYITKILKTVHPGANLKNSSRSLLNKFLVDLSLRLADATFDLNKSSKRKTVSALDVYSAAQLLLNVSLAKHTVTAMNKNVNKAIAIREKAREAIEKGKKGEKVESVTNKTFPIPITRARSFLTLKSERVTANAGVAFSAFLEYIISEILELAGNVARDEKRVAISPHHISKAIADDEDLERLSKTMNFMILGN